MAASSLIPRFDLVWGEPGNERNEASQFSYGITLIDFRSFTITELTPEYALNY